MADITLPSSTKQIADFPTFSNWVNTAASKLGGYDKKKFEFMCIDAGGYLCRIGADFMAAREAGRFPVKAYLIKLSRAAAK